MNWTGVEAGRETDLGEDFAPAVGGSPGPPFWNPLLDLAVSFLLVRAHRAGPTYWEGCPISTGDSDSSLK